MVGTNFLDAGPGFIPITGIGPAFPVEGDDTGKIGIAFKQGEE
jgi:hypothetical protein